VEVRPVRRGGARRPVAVVLLVGVVAGIAILKPWQVPPDRSAAAAKAVPSAVATMRGPAPSAATSPAAPMPSATPTVGRTETSGPPCGPSVAWHVLTMVRSGDIRTRSLISRAPARVLTTADPRLPFTTISADELLAIGYCQPDVDPVPFAGRSAVEVWRLTSRPDRPKLIDDARLLSIDAGTPGERWLIVPQELGRGLLTWDPGRYAVSFTDGATGIRRWVGLDFRSTLAATRGLLPARPSP
jgi:hypothetical protein